jgi:hypothetical protein
MSTKYRTVIIFLPGLARSLHSETPDETYVKQKAQTKSPCIDWGYGDGEYNGTNNGTYAITNSGEWRSGGSSNTQISLTPQ